MMPILESNQTLQTLFKGTTEVARSPPQSTIFLKLLPCLAQHPSAVTSRYPTDKEGRGGLEPPSEEFYALEPPPEDFYALEPPPENFYVCHSFEPCKRQSKRTNAQALQKSSKTNARQNAKAEIETLTTTHSLEMMTILEIIQTLQTLL